MSPVSNSWKPDIEYFEVLEANAGKTMRAVRMCVGRSQSNCLKRMADVYKRQVWTDAYW